MKTIEEIYDWVNSNKYYEKIFMKKIVIITGSLGLVGAEASKSFFVKKFKVIGIDNNMRKYFLGVQSKKI